jgi:hypothetical protein
VVKGYSQIYSLDFGKTYVPVVCLKNLCLLLAIAMVFGLHVHTMDVQSVFLHAHLIKQIYVQQPEGFILAEHPDKVCLLQKSLYGLKQVPHVWNQDINQHLWQHEFQPTNTDPCIYVHHVDATVTFISLYVDDCMIVAATGSSLAGYKRRAGGQVQHD